MRVPRRLLILLCGAATLAGCAAREITRPATIDLYAVDTLVAHTRLPLMQKPVILKIGDGYAYLIKMKYGPPQDCPAGCFYNLAYGLSRSDKTAWFTFVDYTGTDLHAIPLYTLGPEDAWLFRPESFGAMEQTDRWFYRYRFLEAIAVSTTIGSAPLAQAAYALFEFGNYYLAGLLIANPVVRQNREILFTLAGLPEFYGYAAVRNEARMLLGVAAPPNAAHRGLPLAPREVTP